MTERDMYERSFMRPKDFFELSPQKQWQIDKDLGILDWKGEGLTKEEEQKFQDHYVKEKTE